VENETYGNYVINLTKYCGDFCSLFYYPAFISFTFLYNFQHKCSTNLNICKGEGGVKNLTLFCVLAALLINIIE